MCLKSVYSTVLRYEEPSFDEHFGLGSYFLENDNDLWFPTFFFIWIMNKKAAMYHRAHIGHCTFPMTNFTRWSSYLDANWPPKSYDFVSLHFFWIDKIDNTKAPHKENDKHLSDVFAIHTFGRFFKHTN